MWGDSVLGEMGIARVTGICRDPKKIWDLESTGSKIQNLSGYWILCFHVCREILVMSDPVATLSWDAGGIRSQTEKMSLDDVDPGSWLGKLS